MEPRRLSPEDAAKLAALQADVKAGFDQLDAGQGAPLDIEALLVRLNGTPIRDDNTMWRASP